jgi:maleylpyruvate isomerase
MIFYDYWRSSSAWRVRIALAWKGIAHERRVVNLAERGQDAAGFRALNPLGQVPVLVVDDGSPRTLTQSTAILEFLEERYPSPPLLPSTLWARARARQLAATIVSGIQPFQNLSMLGELRAAGVNDPPAFAARKIASGLAALEAAARETAGTFLVGGAPSIAEVCLIPQLYGSRRFGVDLGRFPTLLRAEAAAAALPAFRDAHADAQSDAKKA